MDRGAGIPVRDAAPSLDLIRTSFIRKAGCRIGFLLKFSSDWQSVVRT